MNGMVHPQNVSSLPKHGRTMPCPSVLVHPPHRSRLVHDLPCLVSKDHIRASLRVHWRSRLHWVGSRLNRRWCLRGCL